jgi:predicted permease
MIRDTVRDSRWTRVIEDVASDVRYAARGLRRNPGFTVVAVLTIAIGIGATTAVSSMLNSILLRPLPAVSQPERLFDVSESRSGMTSDMLGYRAVEWLRYEKYAAATPEVWSGLAAHRYVGFSLATESGAVAINGSLTSRNYFDVLGVRPALGRFYIEGDDFPVVLGYALWSSRFGSDPGVIGTTIRLDSRPFTVIGVAPPDFIGLTVGIRSDLWAPMPDYWAGGASGTADWVAVVGRLRAGVELPQASAIVQAAAVNIEPEQPWTTVRAATLAPVTGIPVMARTGFNAFLGMLFATAALVLLIAAGNVAGMLLARSTARGREIAIRLAIGVGSRRLVRQLLVESTVLFLIGGVGGILLAFWLTGVLARSVPALPATVAVDVSPDLRVLAAALVAAAITGIVFGLAPALRSARADVMDALKRGGVRIGTRSRGRSAFVAAQFAMAVLLVVTGGLFVRSLRAALDTDVGFDPDGVVAATIDLRPHGYEGDRIAAFWSELLERVLAVPGVENAGLADWGLMFGPTNGSDVQSSEPGWTEQNRTNARFNSVDPGWLDLMRVPIIAGRAFAVSDNASSPAVILVNETLASRLWPDLDPIGRTISFNARDWEVVGLTRNGKYSTIGEQPTAMLFFPWAQWRSSDATLHVRSGLGAGRLIEQLRVELAAIDPDIALENAAPASAMVGLSLFPQRFAAWLIGGFGVAGLILAMIGVYGVLAFDVERNTREFGIRGALGARTMQLVGAVVVRGLLVAAAGTAAGLLFAAGATRFAGTFLYGVAPLDPLTFGVAAALMLAVAAVAAIVPARRASAIQPIEALRTD